MNMFCYQCEQTSQCTGCTSFGVCGKDPETAALQDLLVQVCKRISVKAHAKRLSGEATREARITSYNVCYTKLLRAAPAHDGRSAYRIRRYHRARDA